MKAPGRKGLDGRLRDRGRTISRKHGNTKSARFARNSARRRSTNLEIPVGFISTKYQVVDPKEAYKIGDGGILRLKVRRVSSEGIQKIDNKDTSTESCWRIVHPFTWFSGGRCG
jgi:hypothetical protein